MLWIFTVNQQHVIVFKSVENFDEPGKQHSFIKQIDSCSRVEIKCLRNKVLIFVRLLAMKTRIILCAFLYVWLRFQKTNDVMSFTSYGMARNPITTANGYCRHVIHVFCMKNCSQHIYALIIGRHWVTNQKSVGEHPSTQRSSWTRTLNSRVSSERNARHFGKAEVRDVSWSNRTHWFSGDAVWTPHILSNKRSESKTQLKTQIQQ